MCECFLLHICCKFGDQQNVFDANVSSDECIGHRWNEVQEPKAFGDVSCTLACLGCYLLDGAEELIWAETNQGEDILARQLRRSREREADLKLT